jgi:hypothetical protein
VNGLQREAGGVGGLGVRGGMPTSKEEKRTNEQ